MTMLVLLLVPQKVICLKKRQKSLDCGPPIQGVCPNLLSSIVDIFHYNVRLVTTLANDRRNRLW